MSRAGLNPREHINLLIFLVQEILQLPNFALECSHSLLKRLGVTPGESSPAELVACLAFEANVGALRTARPDTVTPDFFAPASITCLRYSALRARSNPNNFHGEYARHIGLLSNLLTFWRYIRRVGGLMMHDLFGCGSEKGPAGPFVFVT